MKSPSLECFFVELLLPIDKIDGYLSRLSAMGVDNEHDLRCFASIWNLKKIGMCDRDIQNIMQTLFTSGASGHDRTGRFHWKGGNADEKSQSSRSGRFNPPRLSKNSVIVFQEIGRGASGSVSKALFVPTLTLVAIKRIEIKDAITRKVVGQELKFLYEVAQSQFALSPQSARIPSDDHPLNLLSGQLYSDVIAGSPPESHKEHKVSDNETPEAIDDTSEIHTWHSANCPYIISFFDAYIDPECGAVCLVLEYMNAGSIQSMLAEGKRFDEDDAAVLAFSVLNALIELHSRNILHRDIKPSNILSDRTGRIKLTDFGITKEMLEENKCADSFIGTLAYMSPTQVRGNPYSFEADMWSLGITMIAIMTGRPPYPTDRGPWHLMNAIIQGPQPTLEPDSVSAEMHSFIHECLNQQHQDSACATKLLAHDFLSSARSRGVLPLNSQALLPQPALPISTADISVENVDKIVEAAISWQLEGVEDEEIFHTKYSKDGSLQKRPFDKLPRFTEEKIRGLSEQMLLDPSILQDKFDTKYSEIDALFAEEWSIEGLTKVAWFNRKNNGKVTLNTPPGAYSAQMYNTWSGDEKLESTVYS